jgi:RNA polymerase sigma-70 factor (ECF subfamily)
MQPNDEMILWLAIQNGDRKAFAALFDRHAVALYRFASRLLRDARDAEDVVQEVLLSLLQGNGFNPSRGTFRAYLFGAVRNQARKRAREPDEALPEHVATPGRSADEELAAAQVSQAVVAAIHELPWTQREVLLLFHYEDFSLNQIGDVLNLDLPAVKSRLHRARETLRARLRPYAVQPQRKENSNE